MKTCGKCQRMLPEECFSLRSKKDVCRQYACKSCHKAYASQHYQVNKDRYRETARAWKLANPGYDTEGQRVRAARRRTEQPDKVNANTAARKSYIKRATPSWANKFFIAEAYHIAKVREKMLGGKWHVDHIIPLRGKTVCGLHVENNLQVIPAKVNLTKHATFKN